MTDKTAGTKTPNATDDARAGEDSGADARRDDAVKKADARVDVQKKKAD